MRTRGAIFLSKQDHLSHTLRFVPYFPLFSFSFFFISCAQPSVHRCSFLFNAFLRSARIFLKVLHPSERFLLLLLLLLSRKLSEMILVARCHIPALSLCFHAFLCCRCEVWSSSSRFIFFFWNYPREDRKPEVVFSFLSFPRILWCA